MDNLGDIVPLLIIAASFIFSLIKGVTKKTEKENSKSTLPEELYEEEKYPQTQTSFPPIIKENKSYLPDYISDDDEYEYEERENELKESYIIHNPEVIPAINTASFYQEVEEEPEDISSNHSFNDFGDIEELKKAVIYSEILHRKYS